MVWYKQWVNICLCQVHSITARSVSRQFRESLKAGKPELVDTIFKLPEAKHLTRLQDTVSNSTNEKVGKNQRILIILRFVFLSKQILSTAVKPQMICILIETPALVIEDNRISLEDKITVVKKREGQMRDLEIGEMKCI